MQSSSISPQSRLCRNAALSILALAACAAPAVRAQSLLGSHESLIKQNEEAREHDFTYLRTSSDVRDYAQQVVNSGQLGALMGEVLRGKALAVVLEHATITDASGRPVDLDSLTKEFDSVEGGDAGDEADDDATVESAEETATPEA